MDEVILDILSTYGVETVVIALIINVLTHFLKMPVKAYSKRSGRDVNRYISLIPVFLGFAGAFLYKVLTVGAANIVIDDLAALAVSSASLSLAMFAIIEKFLPKKKGAAAGADATVSEAETLNEMREALETVKRLAGMGQGGTPVVAGLQADAAPETVAVDACRAANTVTLAENTIGTAATETPTESTGVQGAVSPQAGTEAAAVAVGSGQGGAFGGKIILGHKRGRADGGAYPFKTGEEYIEHRSQLIREAVSKTEETANAQSADITE
jgi:hypothetical protein